MNLFLAILLRNYNSGGAIKISKILEYVGVIYVLTKVSFMVRCSFSSEQNGLGQDSVMDMAMVVMDMVRDIILFTLRVLGLWIWVWLWIWVASCSL